MVNVVPVPVQRVLINASLHVLMEPLPFGTRVVAASVGHVHRDMRVWAYEPGASQVMLVTEDAYYAWTYSGFAADEVPWPLAAVWVETEPHVVG